MENSQNLQNLTGAEGGAGDSTQSQIADMDSINNFGELCAVEQQGAAYLQKLEAEVENLKNKAEETRLRREKLEMRKGRLESKLGVSKNKIIDLRVNQFQKRLDTAKALVKATKAEVDSVGKDALLESQECLLNFMVYTNEFNQSQHIFRNEKYLGLGKIAKERQVEESAKKVKAVEGDISKGNNARRAGEEKMMECRLALENLNVASQQNNTLSKKIQKRNQSLEAMTSQLSQFSKSQASKKSQNPNQAQTPTPAKRPIFQIPQPPHQKSQQ